METQIPRLHFSLNYFDSRLTDIQSVHSPKTSGTLGPQSSVLEYYVQSSTIFRNGWINFMKLKRLVRVYNKKESVFLSFTKVIKANLYFRSNIILWLIYTKYICM